MLSILKMEGRRDVQGMVEALRISSVMESQLQLKVNRIKNTEKLKVFELSIIQHFEVKVKKRFRKYNYHKLGKVGERRIVNELNIL